MSWAKTTEWGKIAKYAGQNKPGEHVCSPCGIRKTEWQTWEGDGEEMERRIARPLYIKAIKILLKSMTLPTID